MQYRDSVNNFKDYKKLGGLVLYCKDSGGQCYSSGMYMDNSPYAKHLQFEFQNTQELKYFIDTINFLFKDLEKRINKTR